MAEFDYEEYLNGVGIEKGDILDVASDMLSMRLYCMNKGLDFEEDHLLETLQEMVGTEGTIMVRTFTWDYCKGKSFHYNTSKSRVGTLGDVARKKDGFIRTQHPIYSWAVWGKYQKQLFDMNNTKAFGADTPFFFLSEYGAKQLRIGNTQVDAFTQIHHVEKMVNVPYRYEKYFDTLYYDNNEKIREQKYSMFVRRLDLDASIQNELIDVEKEWNNYPWKKQKIFDGLLWCVTVRLAEAEAWLRDDLVNNYGRKLYTVNGKKGFSGIEKNKIYENEVIE